MSWNGRLLAGRIRKTPFVLKCSKKNPLSTILQEPNLWDDHLVTVILWAQGSGLDKIREGVYLAALLFRICADEAEFWGWPGDSLPRLPGHFVCQVLLKKMWGNSLDEWGQTLLTQNHHPQQANCSWWGWERHGLKLSGSILIYFACIRVLWIERKISVSQNNEIPGPWDNRGKSLEFWSLSFHTRSFMPLHMLFLLLRMPFQPQNAGELRFTLQLEHPLFHVALPSAACPDGQFITHARMILVSSHLSLKLLWLTCFDEETEAQRNQVSLPKSHS